MTTSFDISEPPQQKYALDIIQNSIDKSLSIIDINTTDPSSSVCTKINDFESHTLVSYFCQCIDATNALFHNRGQVNTYLRTQMGNTLIFYVKTQENAHYFSILFKKLNDLCVLDYYSSVGWIVQLDNRFCSGSTTLSLEESIFKIRGFSNGLI